MLCGGSPGGGSDFVEGEEDPPSYGPPQDAGHDGGDAHTGEGPYEELVKVGGALTIGSEEVLALGQQSWVELRAAGNRLCQLAGIGKTGRRAAWLGGRSGEAAVNHRVDGGDERCDDYQEKSRECKRDSGAHAVAAEDSAAQSGECHG